MNKEVKVEALQSSEQYLDSLSELTCPTVKWTDKQHDMAPLCFEWFVWFAYLTLKVKILDRNMACKYYTGTPS
jgi:hypothetical protein